MKVKVESYKIVCDCCGETFHDGNDFVCFSDDPDGGLIRAVALTANWREIDGKHYCPDCWTWDDDDNIQCKDGRKYDEDGNRVDKKYTRTDAFIEKACEWLEPVLLDYAGYYVGTDLIKDFKKAMEGK